MFLLTEHQPAKIALLCSYNQEVYVFMYLRTEHQPAGIANGAFSGDIMDFVFLHMLCFYNQEVIVFVCLDRKSTL